MKTQICPSDAGRVPPERLAPARQEARARALPAWFAINLLLFWHGLFAGSYIVAFASGDAAMGLHIAAGWFVIGLGGLRLLIALAAPEKSPWSLPWPNAALVNAFIRNLKEPGSQMFVGRNLLIVLSGLVLLMAAVLASLSGYLPSEDAHEAIANLSLVFVLVHAGLILLAQGLKKIRSAPSLASTKPPSSHPSPC